MCGTLLVLGLILADLPATAATEGPATKRWPVTIRTLNEVASPFAGVVVEINGRRAGVTDRRGQLPLQLPVGKYRVQAFIPGFQRGDAAFSIESPQTRGLVEVQLDRPDIEIRVLPSRKGKVLPADFDRFAIQLFDRDGRELKIDEINWLQLQDNYSKEIYDISSYLLVQPNGSLRADQPAIKALRKVFARPRAVLKLRISAELANFEKRHVELERWLLIGRYSLRGRVIPPPYKRDLATGNLVLRAHYRAIEPLRGVPFTFTVATDDRGRFALRNLPFGYLRLQAVDGAERSASHDWQWRVKVFGNSSVQLMPQSIAELRRAIPSVAYNRQNYDIRFVTAGEPQPFQGTQ